MVNNNDNHHIVAGDLKSIRMFGKAIVQGLNAKLMKNTENIESSSKVTPYRIDIMGNPANRKHIVLKIVEDVRSETGEIKIEHGAEYLWWQMSISCLCDCCIHNISHARGAFYICTKLAEPNIVINTGLCERYKFSEQKLREYVR